MKRKNVTRNALFTSIISLLLCVSMLVGTTFAWFTDEVTSANNIIKSGNLDVELYYQAEGQNDWTKVDANSNIFKENTLWEPGHTEVVKLKVVNEGTLALKYQLGVNVASETGSVNMAGKDFLLSDHIKFGVVDGAQTYTREQAVAAVEQSATALNVAYTAPTAELPAASANATTAANEAVVTMVVYMPTSVGNEANYGKGAAVPTINLGINLFATQLEAESDSFGPDYDEDAWYPDFVVTNSDELKVALTNGGNVALANDVIISESLPVTKDTVLDLNSRSIGTSGSTTGSPLYLQGGKLTVKNGTLDLDGSHTNVNGTFSVAIGYDAQTELVVENVNFTGTTAINGTFATDGPLKIAISNCTMDVTNLGIAVSANSTEAIATINNCNIDADVYAIFASQGSKITINGGTYKSVGKVITSMYDNTVVTINGGTFDGELWVTDGGSLVIYGGTFTADPSAYVAPGYQVTNNGDGTYTVGAQKVSTGAELVDAIANGKAVELTQDVNLGKIDLTDAITNDVVINANGHKITTTDAYGIEVTAGKNVTISNAEVEMTKEGDYITYAAGFKIANGDYAGSTITLKDCTITMANTDWAYAVNIPASVTNLNLVIDNCTLEGAIAVQCWGDDNTITITNSKLICNYTTNAMYTSYCVALQEDSSNKAENNTLVIDNCKFLYSGIDNFNSQIYAAADVGSENNTITVTNCTYGEKVVAG